MLNTSYNFIYHRKCRTFVVGNQEGGDSGLSLHIQYMDMKNAPPISDAKKNKRSTFPSQAFPKFNFISKNYEL